MATRTTLDAALLGPLRDDFKGDLVLPGDDAYDAARIVWNGVVDRYPAIVARCIGVADVLAALRFAREQDLVVAVRSGGHSVGGFSTCDGGIVIDLSRMRGARIDPDRRVARVNGGALLWELDREAQAFGLACPVGVVGHTGVAGLTLGGGMGRLQRKFGLTIDNLLSADVVTADGRLVHASEDENGDLFWGLRGAGANFGIATSFEFRLHPVGPTITHGMTLRTIDHLGATVDLFRDLVATTSDEMMLTMGIGRALPEDDFPPEVAGQPIVVLSALHCGDPDDAAPHVARIVSLGDTIMNTFARKSYVSVQTMFDEANAWGKRFYMKSGFAKRFPDDLITSSLEHVANAPDDGGVSIWSWGRAISRVPDEATAFTGRDAEYWIAVETIWQDAALDDANVAWGRATMASITPFTTAGHYVNDAVESGEDVVRSIYGDAKFERLRALKRAWDPGNVFHLNQNIRP